MSADAAGAGLIVLTCERGLIVRHHVITAQQSLDKPAILKVLGLFISGMTGACDVADDLNGRALRPAQKKYVYAVKAIAKRRP
jgi:hypothetical protein